jgi:glucose-6-phosphate 1-dehydrogenase
MAKAGWKEKKCQVTGRRPKWIRIQIPKPFAAIKFFIDNWRWEGVPFYVRTGKRMQQSSSVITIQFKNVPHSIFPPNLLKAGIKTG